MIGSLEGVPEGVVENSKTDRRGRGERRRPHDPDDAGDVNGEVVAAR